MSNDIVFYRRNSYIPVFMRKGSVINTYNFYSSFYDILFGRILDSARRKTVQVMRPSNHQRILEMGVGTGLSLRQYPTHPDMEIHGIDISEKMLGKAKKRAKKRSDLRIELTDMDAENTNYPDEYFDKVALMYIYSVTPSPEKLLSEAIRLCKTDGDIYIVNHFSHSKGGKSSFLERLFGSLSNTIGFRSDFSYKTYVLDLGLIPERQLTANLFSLTKIIHLKKEKNLHLQSKKLKMVKQENK